MDYLHVDALYSVLNVSTSYRANFLMLIVYGTHPDQQFCLVAKHAKEKREELFSKIWTSTQDFDNFNP